MLAGRGMLINMIDDLAVSYYRLALSAAAQRDVSAAAMFARYACMLNQNHENAAKLFGLCMNELGYFETDSSEVLMGIRALAGQKKWREALNRAKSNHNNSVRMLNIQGCLYACAKRYGKAARFFSKALEKDRGNRLATACLAEVTRLRCGFWRG